MLNLNLKDIEDYLNPNNIIGVGTEGVIYNYDDKLIKIFHVKRKNQLDRISDLGLINLTKLPLKSFSKPIDIIYDQDKIVGYTKENLTKEEVDTSCINFDEIKKDVLLLSDNGYRMEDIYYNYIYSNKRIHFSDISSFSYIAAKNEYVKKLCNKHNLERINMFLIGLLEFDAFKQEEHIEYKKLYLAHEYMRNNHINEFYGDYLNNKK